MNSDLREVIMNNLFGSDSDGSDSDENDIEELEGDDIRSNLRSNLQAQDGLSSVRASSNPGEDEATNGEVQEESSIGMLYPSLDSLYEAYQAYAKTKGFAVVKRTYRKVDAIDYRYALFVCHKAEKSRTKKTSKRVGCLARVNAIKKADVTWEVSTVVRHHSHELDPNFLILMPAHRSLFVHMKRQLEANDIAGIRPCKNIKLCEVQSGGPMNLGCLPKDCRNFIDERRRLRLGEGDAEAIRKLFARLQQKDRNFYHLMDIDEHGMLRNVLWIHPRSRAAYEEFHDVVSFDTT